MCTGCGQFAQVCAGLVRMEASKELVDLLLLARVASGIARFQHDGLVGVLSRGDHAGGQPARRGIVSAGTERNQL